MMNATAYTANSAGKTIKVVGFGWRLVAALIDGLLVGFLSFLFAFIIGLSSGLLKFMERESSTRLKDCSRSLVLSCLLPTISGSG